MIAIVLYVLIVLYVAQPVLKSPVPSKQSEPSKTAVEDDACIRKHSRPMTGYKLAKNASIPTKPIDKEVFFITSYYLLAFVELAGNV